jgi:hypothetical protein
MQGFVSVQNSPQLHTRFAAACHASYTFFAASHAVVLALSLVVQVSFLQPFCWKGPCRLCMSERLA